MSQPKDGTLVVERQQSLMVREEHSIAPAEQADSLIAVIARAAQDPTVDVEKMERLLALKQKIDDDHRRQVFMAALARVQQKIPHINKAGRIIVKGQEVSRYARLEDIDRVVRPILAEEGLAVSFDTEPHNNNVRVICRLSHEMGHSETKQVDLPIDTSGYKNVVQGVGSTVAYGRRILCKMWFNVIEEGEDIDGHPEPVPLTEAQRNSIINLLNVTKSKEADFCRFMGVAKIEDITQAEYQKGLNALQTKQRQMER